MTTNTPSDDQDSTDDNIAVYHPVEPHETAPETIDTIWSLIQQMCEEHQSSSIHTLAIDIDGHRNSEGGLTHEMMTLLTEFILPVGTAVAEKIILGPFDRVVVTSDEGLDALNSESDDAKDINGGLPEDMDVGEFIQNARPVARYDGQLAYVFIPEDAYSELSNEHGLDDSEIIEHAIEQMD